MSIFCKHEWIKQMDATDVRKVVREELDRKPAELRAFRVEFTDRKSIEITAHTSCFEEEEGYWVFNRDGKRWAAVQNTPSLIGVFRVEKP